MSQTIKDSIKNRLVIIRELRRAAAEARHVAASPHLLPEIQAQHIARAQKAEDSILELEKEIDGFRSSAQLDLFSPQP